MSIMKHLVDVLHAGSHRVGIAHPHAKVYVQVCNNLSASLGPLSVVTRYNRTSIATEAAA
jgi:hypothetical protein